VVDFVYRLAELREMLVLWLADRQSAGRLFDFGQCAVEFETGYRAAEIDDAPSVTLDALRRPDLMWSSLRHIILQRTGYARGTLRVCAIGDTGWRWLGVRARACTSDAGQVGLWLAGVWCNFREREHSGKVR
jgi:hypothetical protein